MPKNKGKGGKKHKKGKNKKGDIEFKRQLRAKAPGEEYARAIKALGSCRFNVIVYYEVKDDLLEDENNSSNKEKKIPNPNKHKFGINPNIKTEFRPQECIGLVRGKMRKRVYINSGDVILVSLRDFDKTKVDIIHKYRDDEGRELVKNGDMPPYGDLSTCNKNQDTDDILFQDDDNNNNNNNNNNNGYTNDIEGLDSMSEDELDLI